MKNRCNQEKNENKMGKKEKRKKGNRNKER